MPARVLCVCVCTRVWRAHPRLSPSEPLPADGTVPPSPGESTSGWAKWNPFGKKTPPPAAVGEAGEPGEEKKGAEDVQEF